MSISTTSADPAEYLLEGESGQAIITYLAIIPICIVVAMILPKVQMTIALGVGIGILFFIISFVKTEIALYLLLFSMLLSPEIGMGGGGAMERSEADRAVAIRLDDMLLLVMCFSFLGRMAVEKEIGFFGKTTLNKYIGMYMAACVFSTLIGVMMGNVRLKGGFFYVLKYFEYYIVFYAVINYIHKEDQVKSFVKVMMLTCFIVCIVGMAQIPGGGRVTAPFEGEQGEPNTLGGYLLFILAINGGIYLHTEIQWLKKILFCNFFIILVPLMATGSRGSWIGLPVVYGVWILYSKKKATLVMAGLVGMLLVPVVTPKTVKDRFMHTFEQKADYRQVKVGNMRIDTSTSARLTSMQDAIQDWEKRPLQGYGVTGYKFIDAQYFKVLVDTGIIGLFAFLALLWHLFKEIKRVMDTVKSPFHRGLAHGFMAGFMGMCAHSVGANTFIIVRVMEPFWFMAGMVMMLPALEAAEEEAREEAEALLEQEAATQLVPEGEQQYPPDGGDYDQQAYPNQVYPEKVDEYDYLQPPTDGRNIDLFR